MSSGSISIDDLRALVDADPRRALESARSSLTAGDSAALWWIVGLAERLLGDTVQARAALERAVELARPGEDRGLLARVTISLALDVGNTGDLPGALRLLETAEPDVEPADHPSLALQRGILHYRLGRFDAALAALSAARDLAVAAADVLSETRVLVNLGAIEAQRGELDVARRHLLRAVDIAFGHDQISWGAIALGNLAFVETLEGNLPEALDAYAAAEEGYRVTGEHLDLPRLYADHASALADANLLDDAEHLIDRAVALSATSGNDLEHAELLLVSAEIDLAKGKADEAHVSAVDAVAAFTRQGRESWLHVAERLRLRAELRLTPDEPGVAEGLVMNGRALAAGGWRSDALSSTLLAALSFVEHGRPDDARALLAAIGSDAAHGRAADKVVIGRVTAMLASQVGDRAGARRAVGRGLREVAAAQAGLGSLEARLAGRPPRRRADRARRPVGDRGQASPRAAAPHRGDAHDGVAGTARAGARRRGDGVAADRVAPVRDRGDRPGGRSGRAAGGRSGTPARRAGDPVAVAPGARRRGEATTTEDAVADAIGHLGDRELVAYANLGGRLWAVVARGGRASLHDLGDVVALDDHLEVRRVRAAPPQPGAGIRGVARRGAAAPRRGRDGARRPAPPGDRRPLGAAARRRADGRAARRAVARPGAAARSGGVRQPVAQRVVHREPGGGRPHGSAGRSSRGVRRGATAAVR